MPQVWLIYECDGRLTTESFLCHCCIEFVIPVKRETLDVILLFVIVWFCRVEMGMFKNNASRFLYVLLLFNFFIVMWLCSFSNLLRFKFISSYTPAYLCDATRICIVIFVIRLYSEFY